MSTQKGIWLSGERTHEGFPLLIRRPADLGMEHFRSLFPVLVTVTHEFATRLPNGLPDPQYNSGLAKLDHELIRSFDLTQTGIPVLVETFGGERNYYFYVAPNADAAEIINGIRTRYPHEKLSWSIRSDPQWGFIQEYAKNHY